MHEEVKKRFEKIDDFIEKLQEKIEKINFEEKTPVDLLGKVMDMQKDIAKATAAEAKTWHYLKHGHEADEEF